MKHTFNVEISLGNTLGKFAKCGASAQNAELIIDISLLLILVYLHDQRYVQRMDQSRQYDDLRGEWE